jgi:hypothetical protein
MKIVYLTLMIGLLCISCDPVNHKYGKITSDKLINRISEIEIEKDFLDEYLVILKEESRASVELEPGVVAIFPLYQIENPQKGKIIEIG